MLLLFLTVIFLSAGYVGQKLSRACVVFVVLICRLSIKHISQNWLLQDTQYSYRYNLSYLTSSAILW